MCRFEASGNFLIQGTGLWWLGNCRWLRRKRSCCIHGRCPGQLHSGFFHPWEEIPSFACGTSHAFSSLRCGNLKARMFRGTGGNWVPCFAFPSILAWALPCVKVGCQVLTGAETSLLYLEMRGLIMRKIGLVLQASQNLAKGPRSHLDKWRCLSGHRHVQHLADIHLRPQYQWTRSKPRQSSFCDMMEYYLQATASSITVIPTAVSKEVHIQSRQCFPARRGSSNSVPFGDGKAAVHTHQVQTL